jgi:predicted RecA/RadA family phage recombinase
MSKNYYSDGNTLDLTAPAGGVVSGVPVKIGSIIAVAQVTAAAGLPFTGKVNGCWNIVKVAGQAWATGDVVYWDDAAKNFTKTAGALQKAGVVVADQLAGDVVGKVRLIPTI